MLYQINLYIKGHPNRVASLKLDQFLYEIGIVGGLHDAVGCTVLGPAAV